MVFLKLRPSLGTLALHSIHPPLYDSTLGCMTIGEDRRAEMVLQQTLTNNPTRNDKTTNSELSNSNQAQIFPQCRSCRSVLLFRRKVFLNRSWLVRPIEKKTGLRENEKSDSSSRFGRESQKQGSSPFRHHTFLDQSVLDRSPGESSDVRESENRVKVRF